MGGDSNDRGDFSGPGFKPPTYDPRTVVAKRGGTVKRKK